MTHTPGPWQWMNRYGFNGNVDGDLHAGARDEHGWDDGCVEVLRGTGWEADGVAATAADARLIAAAPDLYAALLDFAIPIAALVLEGVTLDRYVTPEIARELRRVEPLARAALLKAKGQP